jgi:hypothetical protein
MIISHKYKFIFVKTGKVAGTSVEMALRPHVGTDDIVTPVDSRDEQYAKENRLPAPQNYGRKYWNDKMKIHNIKGCYYEHAYAYEIKGLIGDNMWNDYYTFTIERDPRDKSLSTYYYHKYGVNTSIARVAYYYYLLKRGNSKLSTSSVSTKALNPMIAKVCNLEKWLIEDSQHAFSQNYFRYSANDEIIVDKVFPFSKLNVLQNHLSKIIGVELEFPNLKSGYRKDSVLSVKEKDLLEKLLVNPLYQKELDIIDNFVDP